MRFHWLSALAATTVIFTVVASVYAVDRKPQAWAVLIGVNDYADLEDLKYASQDVQALSKALASAGFPESHVFLLHDEAKDVKFRPLKANIERQLGLLAQLAAKDDLLVIAFSGHGMHLEGKTYLCPAEAQVENPQGTMVALDGVYSQLEKCPAALRLMLVDACRNDPRPKGKKSATPKDDLSSLGKAFERPPDGIVVLASCAPGQISYEEQDFGHGVFMHHVLKGLGGSADSNKNGKVSLGELYEFAASETKTFVARARSDFQSPQLFGRIDGVFEFERAGPVAGETIKNSIGMELVRIPAGEFVMGSPRDEVGHGMFEVQHPVRITKPFYIGKFEVTQAEYSAVLGENPSRYSAEGLFKKHVAGLDTSRFPVEGVNWEDAQTFCRTLSAKEGKSYRLPTEAEWEYACRAGTTSAYNTGDTEADLAKAAWFGVTDVLNISCRPNRVGQKEPNAFGLFDMHGNVEEWCSDWYDLKYYEKFRDQVAVDPQGPDSGETRAGRGGLFLSKPERCRSAARSSKSPNSRTWPIGLRIVLESRD